MTPQDDTALREKILAENRRVHALENALYLDRHPEQTNFYQAGVAARALGRLCGGLRQSPAHILEIGCGTGYLYLPLLARGHTLTGIDLSGEMLAALERRLTPEEKTRSSLIQADAQEYIAGNALDAGALVFSAVLHHLYDYENTVRAACRKLRPGALCLIFFEPLKQEIQSRWRYGLHRQIAQWDEAWYKAAMRRRGIPLFEDDYEYSDYQRRFGGISPERLREIMAAEGMETLNEERYCARRHGLAAWAANTLLRTANTFNLLARKA